MAFLRSNEFGCVTKMLAYYDQNELRFFRGSVMHLEMMFVLNVNRTDKYMLAENCHVASLSSYHCICLTTSI